MLIPLIFEILRLEPVKIEFLKKYMQKAPWEDVNMIIWKSVFLSMGGKLQPSALCGWVHLLMAIHSKIYEMKIMCGSN